MFAVLNAIEGGSDTTRATLNVFIAAMATDPEFLIRVRKELDSVCGQAGRLPTFEDQMQLPLVTACVKEVLRWMPLVAAGVVRVLIQDDQFEDYYFPKGTRFSMFPLWGLLTVAWSRRYLARDASIYPDDPMRFYPERFLNDDLDKPLAGHWAFGMGRRGDIPLRQI
jgi:cytochrome P450